MNTTSEFSGALRSVFEGPTRGVVGLVDDLLRLCQEHGLQLNWQADRCRVRSPAGRWEEVLSAPLRKSVFRAVLARVAALCNERSPNSVSPYGGQGKLVAGADPATVFRVSFANTPDEQWFTLSLLTRPAPTGETQCILEYLNSGPKTYSAIRRFLYLNGWDIRSSATSRMIDELLAQAVIELEAATGELRLTTYGRTVTDNPTAA
jgi:hypothetical protein